MTAQQRSYTELRALRNRCLRAVADNNASTLEAAFHRMTPAELRALKADAVTIAWCVQSFLDGRPDVMKEGPRDE